jgi:glucose-6-phosphate dehydrogenase assembly protein OpcA
MEDVWTARATTPSAIEAALRDLLVRRHKEAESFVPARVLNLVVVVDRAYQGEVENRLERVGRYHPSRLVLCGVEPKRTKLDAMAVVGDAATSTGAGTIMVGHERVELEIGTEHLSSLATIVDPLLVPDLTTVVWAPHGHGEAFRQLCRLANVALIDSQDATEVEAALEGATTVSKQAYVVDLAWLRSTPWRERVAAAFDPPALRRSLGEITTVAVRHRADSAAAALLFCGWLTSRLGWRPEALARRNGGFAGHARAKRSEVAIRLDAVEQRDAPGLAGVTIELASGAAFSLDRAPGGLRSVRRARDGSEQVWTVLGASRGEGGILGEGVRQALLRDPTYQPALRCARAMLG